MKCQKKILKKKSLIVVEEIFRSYYEITIQCNVCSKNGEQSLKKSNRNFRRIPGINKLSEPAHYASPRLELDGVTTAAGHLVYRRTRHLGEARTR